ncbi:hypothetical protein J6590_025713 [Homalodisca vitripennis]|nr:hypothetical protein J6590_025713 [Homalodisca vitripennis]
MVQTGAHAHTPSRRRDASRLMRRRGVTVALVKKISDIYCGLSNLVGCWSILEDKFCHRSETAHTPPPDPLECPMTLLAGQQQHQTPKQTIEIRQGSSRVPRAVLGRRASAPAGDCQVRLRRGDEPSSYGGTRHPAHCPN